MPIFQYGPIIFASGTIGLNSGQSAWTPKRIQGPDKPTYIVEHKVPGAEGGVVEYLGSQQTQYKIEGFIAPQTDAPTGTAATIISGNSVVLATADAAYQFLYTLRTSGLPQIMRVESPSTNLSGYSIMYENDFYWVEKITFAMEPGRQYPYYPYTLMLRRASTNRYGNNQSGTVSQTVVLNNFAGNYLSGYIHYWQLLSGLPKGEIVASIGLLVPGVASGDAQVAVYSSGGNTLQAQSVSQAVHSGWNYFALNPTFTTTSGVGYVFALKGDANNTSGYAVSVTDVSTTSGSASIYSGVTYSAAFPASLAPNTLANVSGINTMLDMAVA